MINAGRAFQCLGTFSHLLNKVADVVTPCVLFMWDWTRLSPDDRDCVARRESARAAPSCHDLPEVSIHRATTAATSAGVVPTLTRYSFAPKLKALLTIAAPL